jgi:hypothetical protein
MRNHVLESVVTPPPYVPKFFDSEQMETINALSEAIIPQDAHSPGARAAGVNNYIDEIISGSGEEEKAFWGQGLAAMDKMAKLEQGRKFKDCTQEQQRDLVTKISEHEDHPVKLEERFFVAVKKSTVDGYYTSAIGIHQELQYLGNTYIPRFAGCEHEEHKS